MKKLFSGLLAACLVMSLISCTKVVYSHEDYMSRFKTKQDVLNSFGLPTEKKIDGKIVEWMYDYRKGPSHPAKGAANSINSNTSGNDHTVADLTDYKKNVRFTFDENDKVINYTTQEVNFAEKKPATGKTILLVLGILMTAALAGGLAMQAGGY